jgi:hypothetical protein
MGKKKIATEATISLKNDSNTIQNYEYKFYKKNLKRK